MESTIQQTIRFYNGKTIPIYRPFNGLTRPHLRDPTKVRLNSSIILISYTDQVYGISSRRRDVDLMVYSFGLLFPADVDLIV